MYVPSYSRVDDPAVATALMHRHSFALLVTQGASGLTATHLPFLHDPAVGPHGSLLCHLARANPQWRDFADGREVLVVFQGEHGYISPAWYPPGDGSPQVPTWNYEAVHASGVPRILDDRETGELLVRTARHYEGKSSGYEVPADFLKRNARAVVGFEIPITRLETKLKLSQNRRPDEVLGLVMALERQADPASRRLAAAMRQANGLLVNRGQMAGGWLL